MSESSMPRVGFVSRERAETSLVQALVGRVSVWMTDDGPDVAGDLGGGAACAGRVASPAAVAARSDVLLIWASSSLKAREILFGPDGAAEGLAAGKIVVDLSRGSPREARDTAERLGALGVELVEAPWAPKDVSATLVAAGPPAAFDIALPLLRALNPSVHRCAGGPGAAQAMATLRDAMSAACKVATLELVALGRKQGLSLETMTAVINKGTGRNHWSQTLLPALERGDLPPGEPISRMRDSLDQAATLGRDGGVPMILSACAAALIGSAVNARGSDATRADLVAFVGSLTGTNLAGAGDQVVDGAGAS